MSVIRIRGCKGGDTGILLEQATRPFSAQTIYPDEIRALMRETLKPVEK